MKHHKLSSRLSAVAVVLGLCASVNAYAIDYSVNLSGTGGNGTLTGNIVTDGTIGALTFANITDWSFTWTWNSTVFSVDKSNTFRGLAELGAGGKLQATESSLFMLSSDTEDLSSLSFRQFAQPQFWFSVYSGGLNHAGVVTPPSSSVSFVLGGTSGVTIPIDFPGTQFTIGTVAAVPEPSTYALMGLGLLGLAAAVRRQRQAA